MDKPCITELENKHAGQMIAVLGGAPSLQRDLQCLPKAHIRIGVNQHAFKAGIDFDYLVYLDPPTRAKHIATLKAAVDGSPGAIRISRHHDTTNYIVANVRFWNASYSGLFACWVACYLGGDPVVLCGIDCYRDHKLYCHNPNEFEFKNASGNAMKPLHNQLNNWRSAFSKCPNPERIHAVSGPLLDVFPKYERGQHGGM